MSQETREGKKGEKERKKGEEEKEKRKQGDAPCCWCMPTTSCCSSPTPSTSPEMKEVAPSFIFFKLKPWRSLKVDLLPQAIPAQVAAVGDPP